MFSAALETALKVRETALVSAQGFSVADFLHGPIAPWTRARPCSRCAPGPAAADVDEAVEALQQRGADVQLMPRVGGLPEALAPIAASVRGQQLALELALRKGLTPTRRAA